MITEFGAQALPNLASLRKTFSEAELWPDNDAEWSKWEYHNFQKRETFEIAKVPMGSNPQEFINNTQQYQAKLIQFAAEAYRRQRFRPVTSLFQFMFVENWPSINWGIVDYWRNAKPGYQALAIAYQPILPSIVWQKDVWNRHEVIALDLWVINDLWQKFPRAKLTYTLQAAGQILDQRTINLDIEPDSGKSVTRLRLKSLEPGSYELTVTAEDRKRNFLGRNKFRFIVEA